MIQFSTLIHYDELRMKWHNIMAGRPQYRSGLMSISTMLQLKGKNSQEDSIQDSVTTRENMVQWVDQEFIDCMESEAT